MSEAVIERPNFWKAWWLDCRVREQAPNAATRKGFWLNRKKKKPMLQTKSEHSCVIHKGVDIIFVPINVCQHCWEGLLSKYLCFSDSCTAEHLWLSIFNKYFPSHGTACDGPRNATRAKGCKRKTCLKWARRCSASSFNNMKLHPFLQRKTEVSPGSLLTPFPPHSLGNCLVLYCRGWGKDAGMRTRDDF